MYFFSLFYREEKKEEEADVRRVLMRVCRVGRRKPSSNVYKEKEQLEPSIYTSEKEYTQKCCNT